MRLCGGSGRVRVGSRERCEEAAGGCGSREVRVCRRQRRRVRLERDSRLPVWREGVGEDRERGRVSVETVEVRKERRVRRVRRTCGA